MSQILISIILPSRNEFPNIVHTIYSIWHSLEAEGFDVVKDTEIILVDNCSDDDVFPQRGTKGTTSYLEGRGAYYNGILRILRDPIAGNHSARNKGVKIARGKYVFFSDAHMAYKPGFFTKMIKAVDESGGLAHGAIQWMGAYPPTDHSMGYGYTLKLGEEIKGTWNNRKLGNEWFYVPAQGHWGVMALKSQFLDFGGYPKFHRTYGGGEFYLDVKWWLFGSCVVVEPNAIGYHLASGRGYSYHHDDYIHNVFNIGYALGMDDWLERTYINYLKRGRKEVLDKMMNEAKREMESNRQFIAHRRKITFNELLVKQPWWELSKKKFNNPNLKPSLLIYHDTWLAGIKNTPAEKAYKESTYQEGLDKFIREKLYDFVYKPSSSSSPSSISPSSTVSSDKSASDASSSSSSG